MTEPPRLNYGWCDFCRLPNSLLSTRRHKGKQICLACEKRLVGKAAQ